MNDMLMELWNRKVKEQDTIYHLGDWAYCSNKPVIYWLSKVSGNKIMIHGSHDKTMPHPNYQSCILRTSKHTFKLMHNPERNGWQEWIIHGHHHNNHPDIFPFINGINKTINVSVELIDYTPIDLDYLESLDINSIKYMKSIHSNIIRW
ncbi:MAG: hypothetical protein WC516_07975 [Patescibacteria group bacterium]|jgi:calcineurin-like phosphoesterase family protein